MNRKCPVCNSKKKSEIIKNMFEIPTVGGFYSGNTIVECSKCGMIYADDIPGEAEFAEYYAAQDKKASHFTDSEPLWYQELHRNTAKWLADKIKPDRIGGLEVLDAGCFTGDLMIKLEDENGFELVRGYDPSKSGIQIALDKGFDIDLTDSFGHSSFREHSFDITILSHVLEHICNPIAFLRDIELSVTRGGAIFVEVPDLSHCQLSTDPKAHIDQREPMLQLNSEHINFFDTASLARLFLELGWEPWLIEECNDSIAVLRGIFIRKGSGRKHIENYVVSSQKIIANNLQTICACYKESRMRLYIWGAGGHTQRMFAGQSQYAELIYAFIDNSPQYEGGTLMGVPVIKPSDIEYTNPIVISSMLYQDEIEAEIKRMGLTNRIIKLYENKS